MRPVYRNTTTNQPRLVRHALFSAWLEFARTLDWSSQASQQSTVLAFSALQRIFRAAREASPDGGSPDRS